jgi:hypothetical protein
MTDSPNSTLARLTWCAANLLSDYNLETLPTLHALEVGQGYHEGQYAWQVRAQLHTAGTELDQIDAIRAWAQALGGVVLLDGGYYSRSTSQSFRTLSALYRLDDDVLFEVWTHIAITITPADAPASELVSA